MRGVLASVLGLINRGATHVGGGDRSRHRVVPQPAVAGVQDRRRHRAGPASRSFRCSRTRCEALGVTVWPMVECEADDALAAAAMTGRGGSGRRARGHLHARQGPGAVRPRQPRRAAEPADERRARRGRRREEVRRAAGVDSRLPRARGRRGRRVSRPARLGCQVNGGGSRPVRQAGGDPDGLARVARQREECRDAGADARARAGPRVAVQGSGHAADGHVPVRLRGRPAMDRADRALRAARRETRAARPPSRRA